MFAKFPKWSVGSNFSDCIVRWYYKVAIDSVNTKTLLPSLLKLFKYDRNNLITLILFYSIHYLLLNLETKVNNLLWS